MCKHFRPYTMSSVQRLQLVSCHSLPSQPSRTSKDTLCTETLEGKVLGLWNHHFPRHYVSVYRKVTSPRDSRPHLTSEDIFLRFCQRALTSRTTHVLALPPVSRGHPAHSAQCL